MATFYINNLEHKTTVNHQNLLQETFPFMYDFYKRHYPNFQDWFIKKVIKDFHLGKRNIYLIQHEGGSSNIYGVAIVKFSQHKLKSNKLCSFFLLSETRKYGVGKELMRKIIEDTEANSINRKIIVTVPEERVSEKVFGRDLSKFLEFFGFYTIDAIPGRYRSGKTEYIYQKIFTLHNYANHRNSICSSEPCSIYNARQKKN